MQGFYLLSNKYSRFDARLGEESVLECHIIKGLALDPSLNDITHYRILKDYFSWLVSKFV